ncbi:MAG TPA: recombinase RecT [Anaerohalosphaeraceae bacterium]|nr:recombinase RecT [Anaerohalosphaeraceae bacterium]
MEEKQAYDLSVIAENREHTFLLKTRTNTIVPLNIKAIMNLVRPPSGQRGPDVMECLKLIDVALGHGADPYAGECGLLPVFSGGFHYEVWVAAQVRMRKALSQPDYEGFEWGYITDDYVRNEVSSPVCTDKVIGLWGRVYRKGRKPFYHEVWLSEVKRSDSEKSSWARSPILMMQKVLRDQAHKFAYADVMGNLNTDEELAAYNEIPAPSSTIPPRNRRRVSSQEITYESCLERFRSRMEKVLGALPNEEESKTMFTQFAANTLLCSEEDVSSPEKYTAEMLAKLDEAIAELDKEVSNGTNHS